MFKNKSRIKSASASATLTLYEVLGRYFSNDEDAKAAVEAIEQVSERTIKTMETNLLTKEDKTDLIREMKSDKAELIDRISKTKLETIFWVVGAIIVHVVLSVIYINLSQL